MAERVVTLTPDEEAALRKVVGPVPGVEHLFRDVQVQAKRDPRVADIHTVPPEVDFLTTRIPPPTAFYLAREDQLRISLWNSVTNVTVFMGARFLLPSGRLIPWVEQFTPAATRAEVVTVLPPAEGYLLGLYFGTSAALQPGQCYVSCVVTRPKLAAGSHVHPLAAGYITTSARPGWPTATLRDARDGQGAIRTIIGTTPAAGSEISETVPTGNRWRLISLKGTLAAGVGTTHRAQLTCDDGTTAFTLLAQVAVQGQGTVGTYTWAAGMPYSVAMDAADNLQGLPPQMLLLSGWRIRTVTLNMAATSQWSAIGYVVEEWIDT